MPARPDPFARPSRGRLMTPCSRHQCVRCSKQMPVDDPRMMCRRCASRRTRQAFWLELKSYVSFRVYGKRLRRIRH